MLKGLILICALTGPCDERHATDVIRVPGVSNALPTHCPQQAEAFLAGTALGRDLRGSIVKVLCERDRRSAKAGVNRQLRLP